MDNALMPYSIWDTYRKTYNWKLVFEFQNETLLDKGEFSISYLNGEMNEIFSKKFALEVDGKKSLQKFLVEEYEKRTFPKSIGFGYIDKDNVEYSAGTFLNEQSARSF